VPSPKAARIKPRGYRGENLLTEQDGGILPDGLMHVNDFKSSL
jgi:hypothetical protein